MNNNNLNAFPAGLVPAANNVNPAAAAGPAGANPPAAPPAPAANPARLRRPRGGHFQVPANAGRGRRQLPARNNAPNNNGIAALLAQPIQGPPPAPVVPPPAPPQVPHVPLAQLMAAPIDPRPAINIGYTLTKRQKEYFDMVYPSHQFTSTHPMAHPHGTLALERRLSESVILNHINSITQQPPGAVIVHDVGGSAPRHHRLHREPLREYVHCSKPLLSYLDHARVAEATALGIQAKFCTHLGQACMCQQFHSAMFIHSSYYMTPVEILMVTLNTTSRTSYIACHTFGTQRGYLGLGEATWVNDAGIITMQVTGNHTPYRHATQQWLRERDHLVIRHYDPVTNTYPTHVLQWAMMQSVGSTMIYRLHAFNADLTEHLDVDTKYTINLFGFRLSLNPTAYYSRPMPKVPDYRLNEPDFFGYVRSVNVTEDIAHHETTVDVNAMCGETYSVGKLLMFLPGYQPETVYIPKELLSEIQLKMVGRKRDPDLMARIDQDFRVAVKKYPFLNQMELPSICKAIKFMVMNDIDQDMKFLKALPLLKFAEYNSALAFQFNPAAATPWLTFAASLTGAAFMLYFYKRKRLTTKQSWMTTLISFLTQWLWGRLHNRTHIISDVCVGSDSPIPPQQIESNVIVQSYTPCAPRVGVQLIGPYLDHFTPFVPRACVHNELAAIHSRNNIADVYDETLCQLYVQYCKDNDLAITGGRRAFHRYPFTYWVKRFPPNQQARLKIAYDSNNDNAISVVDAFVKKEILFKKFGVAPRLIQGRKPTYTATLGPVMYSISKHLSNQWSFKEMSQATCKIVYATGYTANGLAQQVQKCYDFFDDNNVTYYIRESDMGRFDGHFHKYFIQNEHNYYRKFPLTGQESVCLEQQLTTTGFTPHGVSYFMLGKRKSGDLNTSVGNSLENARMHIYACSLIDKRHELKIPIQLYFTGLVLGDDSWFLMNSKLLPYDQDITQIIEDMGMAPKAIIRQNLYDSEFCSGRFWPSSKGRIWAPKIGRVLYKSMTSTTLVPADQTKAWLVAVAKGFKRDTSHVPLLRILMPRLAELSFNKPVKPHYLPRALEIRPHNIEDGAEATQDTWEMMYQLYDLLPHQIQEAENYLKTCPTYGALKHAVIDAIVKVDLQWGTMLDTEEDYHVEEEGPDHSAIFSTMSSVDLIYKWLEDKSNPSAASYITTVFVSPVLEETFKHHGSRKSRLLKGFAFGLTEGLLKIGMGHFADELPLSIIFHTITALMPFKLAVAFHMAWNALALSLPDDQMKTNLKSSRGLASPAGFSKNYKQIFQIIKDASSQTTRKTTPQAHSHDPKARTTTTQQQEAKTTQMESERNLSRASTSSQQSQPNPRKTTKFIRSHVRHDYRQSRFKYIKRRELVKRRLNSSKRYRLYRQCTHEDHTTIQRATQPFCGLQLPWGS
jgi:hypothetical protein